LARSVGASGEARRALGELLGTRVVRVRRAAVTALAESADPEARRVLAAHYPRATDPRERFTIEGALGR
jgi:hypothetical protein